MNTDFDDDVDVDISTMMHCWLQLLLMFVVDDGQWLLLLKTQF